MKDRDLDFDHASLYYRALGDGQGYCYRTNEPEEIVKGTRTYDTPFYEFDSIETIGKSLYLADRVLVLRIPEDALVEENTPISQGGCMRYSASRVAPVAILCIDAFLRHYEERQVTPSALHLKGQDLRRIQLPRTQVRRLYLTDCVGPLDVDAAGLRESLMIWYGDVQLAPWTRALEDLTATGLATPLAGPIAVTNELSLSSVTLEQVVVRTALRCASLFTCQGQIAIPHLREGLSISRSTLHIGALPPSVRNLYASDSRISGVPDLPAAESRHVSGCAFSPDPAPGDA